MNLAPIVLERDEIYGSLRVLRRTPSGKYRVGCGVCGNSRDIVRASALMSGRVKKCSRCRKADASQL